MALEFSTAGMTLKYCVETTSGTRPTSGYTTIPQVKSIPEINAEPNTLQTTPLNQTVAHTYIPGLRDSGGAIGFTVNDTVAFRSAWATLVSAAATAEASDKACWFEIAYPDDDLDSYYFTATPVALGFGGAEVDSVLENTAYVVPNTMGTPTFDDASTDE